MNTAVINIKTNPSTKIKAQEIARELGFSLSALINGYLKHLVKTKNCTFYRQRRTIRLDYQDIETK